jgi:hypothetical protein
MQKSHVGRQSALHISLFETGKNSLENPVETGGWFKPALVNFPNTAILNKLLG